MDQLICNAWRRAAIDLRIRVVAPLVVTLADGRIIAAEAHILDFGHPAGAVALSTENPLVNHRAEIALWSSILVAGYRTYERTLFTDTLNDWGWFGGDEGRPDWYSGKSWNV